MNLQALYDLKERLEHAAIAGTGLLQEDFRLRRAVEALTPLAAASPVFSKISTGASALLQAPEQERSARLLDVLSLVDAVVYTQGTTNLPGELVEPEPGSGNYVQASYGQLQPLLAALSGTGSGRTSLIRDYWTNHPEYFGDFRVLPHVVSSLGDNYAELAQLICEILLKQGGGIIPLLKENFDPAGKTEMARRVRLIAQLAGQDENDWFTTVLPDSKKDVREALIQALSLSRENNQLLLDLCRTEKGKLKEAALRSLAFMQTQEAEVFWTKEMQKKPNLVSCLKGVDSELAADLCAAEMSRFLEVLRGKMHYNTEQMDMLVMLTDAICGKCSKQVIKIWKQISQHMREFSQLTPDESIHSGGLSVAEYLQRCMMLSVLSNPCSEMIVLAGELAEMNRPFFLCCSILAELLMRDPQHVFSQFGHFFIPDSRLISILDCNINTKLQILKVFAAVKWEKQGFCLEYRDYDKLSGTTLKLQRSIPGLDPRWAMHLASTDHRINISVYDLISPNYPKKIETTSDYVLMKMIDPGNSQLCEICGRYLSGRIRRTGKLTEYMDGLIQCNWRDWRGMIVKYVRKENQVKYYRVMEILEKLPMTNGQKAAELRELNQLVENGSVSVWAKIWPEEQIGMMIAQMEANPNSISGYGGK